MEIRDSFQPVPAMAADEVREFMKTHDRESYVLLDVRQSEEYEQKHLPGAELVPMGDLIASLPRMDADKTTIVYCRSGNRSGAVTALLLGRGFREVHNMAGGITAWNGFIATGGPEAGMALFPDDARVEELMGLAWALEEGTRVFYRGLSELVDESECKDLLQDLIKAEEGHKGSIARFYRKTTGKDDIASHVDAGGAGETLYMEGGVPVGEALDWAKGKPIRDALECAMSLETESYDLYTRIARRKDSNEIAEFFTFMADEEWRHLKAMSSYLSRKCVLAD